MCEKWYRWKSICGLVFLLLRPERGDEPDNIANNPIETLNDIEHSMKLFIEWTCPNITSNFNCTNQFCLHKTFRLPSFITISSINEKRFMLQPWWNHRKIDRKNHLVFNDKLKCFDSSYLFRYDHSHVRRNDFLCCIKKKKTKTVRINLKRSETAKKQIAHRSFCPLRNQFPAIWHADAEIILTGILRKHFFIQRYWSGKIHVLRHPKNDS